MALNAKVPIFDTVAEAVGSKSLPVWAEQCNKVNPTCEADWRATIGVLLGK